MYTLVRCHVKDRSGWSAINAANKTLSELESQYSNVRLYVKADNEGAPTKEIELIESFGVIPSTQHGMTVTSWLAAIDSEYIRNEFSGVTLDKVGALRRADVWEYDLAVSVGNASYGEGVEVPKGLNTDIALDSTREVNVINNLTNNCLMSVNGRLVKMERSGDRLFGINGAKHLGHEDQNISILNFKELGPFSTMDLTESNCRVIPRTQADRDNRTTRINVTMDTSTIDKTILAVIDGYPHFLDKSLQVYDADNVILHLDHNKLVKRRLADNVLADSASVGTTVQMVGMDIDGFNVEEYLISTDSFLVIINNNDISRYTRLAGRTDIVGLYISPFPPQGLLLDETGRLLEYHIEGTDGDQTSVNVPVNIRRHYLHDHSLPSENIASFTGIDTPGTEVVDAYFVDLYTTKPV